MKLVRVVVFLCAISAGTVSVYAQQSVDLASVSGRVTDPSGAVVPGAQITFRHTQTNLTSTAVSDQEGRFRLPYLRVGPYEIVVRQQGFQDAIRHLTLIVGAAFELPVSLSLGAVDTNVTVRGDATVLEAARSQIASMGLHRFGGHLPKGGYDVHDGNRQTETTGSTAIRRGVQGQRGAPRAR